MLPQARTPRVRCRAFSAQVDGAISDARLQRLRWMRAIRLLIGRSRLVSEQELQVLDPGPASS